MKRWSVLLRAGVVGLSVVACAAIPSAEARLLRTRQQEESGSPSDRTRPVPQDSTQKGAVQKSAVQKSCVQKSPIQKQ